MIPAGPEQADPRRKPSMSGSCTAHFQCNASGNGYCVDEFCVCNEGYAALALCYNRPADHLAFVVFTQVFVGGFGVLLFAYGLERLRVLLLRAGRGTCINLRDLTDLQWHSVLICALAALFGLLQAIFLVDAAGYWAWFSFGFSRSILSITMAIIFASGTLYIRQFLVIQARYDTSVGSFLRVFDVVAGVCAFAQLLSLPFGFVQRHLYLPLQGGLAMVNTVLLLCLLGYHVPRTYASRTVPREGTPQREAYDRATQSMRRSIYGVLGLGISLVLYVISVEVLVAMEVIRKEVVVGMITEIVSRGVGSICAALVLLQYRGSGRNVNATVTRVAPSEMRSTQAAKRPRFVTAPTSSDVYLLRPVPLLSPQTS